MAALGQALLCHTCRGSTGDSTNPKVCNHRGLDQPWSLSPPGTPPTLKSVTTGDSSNPSVTTRVIRNWTMALNGRPSDVDQKWLINMLPLCCIARKSICCRSVASQQQKNPPVFQVILCSTPNTSLTKHNIFCLIVWLCMCLTADGLIVYQK